MLDPDASRLYAYAIDLSPELPETRLYALLPKITRDLVTGAVLHKFSNPQITREQAAALYLEGREQIVGEPSLAEFKSDICYQILQKINADDDMTLERRLDLQERLAKYYKSNNIGTEKRFKFGEKLDNAPRFFTGFEPLDRVFGNKGITPGILTTMGLPGVGKTFIEQAIANVWPGPVKFYDVENFPELLSERQAGISSEVIHNKEYICGFYNIHNIYDELQQNPDPDMLIVLDSIGMVCGHGKGANDASNYSDLYEIATKMISEGLCRFIIMSTHPKYGADGTGVYDTSASIIIGKATHYMLNISKRDMLPDGYTEMGFKAVKSRSSVTGKEVTFSFRHADGTVGEILTGGL